MGGALYKRRSALIAVALLCAATLGVLVARPWRSGQEPAAAAAVKPHGYIRVSRLPAVTPAKVAAARPPATPTPGPAPARERQGVPVALARVAKIPVYASPAAGRPRLTLSRADILGVARSFLVKERRGGWLRVMLPVRPNSSTGWIRVGDVTLRTAQYRIRVELRSHRLTLLRDDEVVHGTATGAGAPATPTPTGEYFVTDVVRLTDPGGPYGPFAIGLSAYSTVYDTFGPGPAQIAIHGTNDPGSVGVDQSNGCIHVDNADIAVLARFVELGTPVTIVR